ncbi:hypothetical protein RCL1_003403 [Eukaryota sp. TZLM3-RCL]
MAFDLTVIEAEQDRLLRKRRVVRALLWTSVSLLAIGTITTFVFAVFPTTFRGRSSTVSLLPGNTWALSRHLKYRVTLPEHSKMYSCPVPLQLNKQPTNINRTLRHWMGYNTIFYSFYSLNKGSSISLGPPATGSCEDVMVYIMTKSQFSEYTTYYYASTFEARTWYPCQDGLLYNVPSAGDYYTVFGNSWSLVFAALDYQIAMKTHVLDSCEIVCEGGSSCTSEVVEGNRLVLLADPQNETTFQYRKVLQRRWPVLFRYITACLAILTAVVVGLLLKKQGPLSSGLIN